MYYTTCKVCLSLFVLNNPEQFSTVCCLVCVGLTTVQRYCAACDSARRYASADIKFTLRRVLAMFTRSAIIPPKVNRFG